MGIIKGSMNLIQLRTLVHFKSIEPIVCLLGLTNPLQWLNYRLKRSVCSLQSSFQETVIVGAHDQAKGKFNEYLKQRGRSAFFFGKNRPQLLNKVRAVFEDWKRTRL